MEITEIGPGEFASNCYLITQGSDAVLIDCSAPVTTVEAALYERGAHLRAIFCTHGHFDHLLTADDVRQRFGVPLYLHKDDAELPSDGHKNAFATFFGFDRSWRPAEQTFADGDTLSFGSLSFKVLHTPGHTRGSSVFLTGDAVFTGDTLFVGGYGRTDLYGGDHLALCRSLEALSRLSPTLTVYPGHGESGTLSFAIKQFRQ